MPTSSKNTQPGFTLKSERFSLMLMTAHQFGIGARDVEHGVNWRGVMKIVLHAFEKNFDNSDEVKDELREMLTETITFMGDFEVEVGIYEELFFPGPRGHKKRIKISLNDHLSTSVEFCIRKRNNMKSLKDLCMDALVKEIKDGLLINNLNLPATLAYSLRNEYYKYWASEQFPQFNINMLPYKEAMKRKMEHQMEKERETKKPTITIHRFRL